MANIENYLFNVDADVSKAVAKLQEINKHMNTIERNVNKAVDDYSTTTQKDMDKSMRAMSRITKAKQEIERELQDLKRLMQDTAESNIIPPGATEDQIKAVKQLRETVDTTYKAIINQQSELDERYKQTLHTMKQFSNMQQNYSKNFKHVFSSNDIRNLPDDLDRARKVVKVMANEADGVSSKLDDVVSKIKEVNKLDRRSESLSRRAAASNYMSYQQSKSFFKDWNTVGRDYHITRDSNIETLASLGRERSRVHNRVKELERKPNATSRDIDEKIALQETIQAIDKEWEARMELNRVLERTITNMKDYNRSIEGVEVKPERGTFAGMMYERAPAIGLALMGGVTAALSSLYMRGTSVEQSMRPDVISIGQRTGTDTGNYGMFGGTGWREGIRDNAMNMGLQDRLGFTGQEMLAFQENYLSNAGYKGMDDLNTAAQQQAIFSRVSGMDADTTRQFYDSIFSTGAVDGTQAKDIQNAFLGAIKNSGMEGREKDQIAALEGILESVKNGREMTSTDVLNVQAFQSLLAQSGSRSLRGESGGQFMTSLNEGIRNGFDNPTLRMMFGMGSTEQGIGGRWNIRKQMEKGISDISNVERLAGTAMNIGGSDIDMQYEAFASLLDTMGVEATTDQVTGIMDMFRSGKLNQESLDSILSGDLEAGEQLAEERYDNYKNSAEATANQSEAVTDKQAVQMTDFADAIKAANTAMAGFPPAIYAATVALAAFAATATLSGAGFLLSRGIRMGSAGQYGRNLTWKDRLKNMTSFGGGGGGWFGFGGGGGKNPPPGTSPNPGGGRPGGGPNVPPILGPDGKPLPQTGSPTPSTTPPKAGGLKDVLGKAGGILSKVLLPLSLLTGAISIASAPEGQKGEATGSVVGGLGGAFAGAKGGAALGALAGPWGAVIGGLLGGIGGGIAGSGLGKWFGGLFGADEASAAELTPEDQEKLKQQTEASTDNKLDQQVDRETANTKERTEDKKSDNLLYERENLHTYETLLVKAEQLLLQARSQNGIFGNGSMSGGGAMNASFTPGEGGLNFIANGGQWTNQDLRKHDLKSTDAAITADDLNAWINSKAPEGSVMRNMGDAFMQAAQSSGLDPRYLVAHAAHETGWGTSNIAKTKGNMYGIGAFDASPYASAYGYDNAEAGIIEGANWIAKNYYGKGQTTLESMRHNGGKHEYATDPLWDEKIANIMSGSPKGSGSQNVNVASTITVKVEPTKDVADQISNSEQLKTVAQNLQNKVYGSMNYHSKEMRRV